MESNTFHNATPSWAMAGRKLIDLPNELILCIFGKCSNLQSLKNLTLSRPHFYRLFAPRLEVIATTVLRCQVPAQTFPVLRTTLHTNDLDIPNLLELTLEDRARVVNSVPSCYENDLPSAVPVAEAIALERLYYKVDGLAGVFMRDKQKWGKVSLEDACVAAVKARFHLVQRAEIQQAICMFEIARRTLGQKTLPRGELRNRAFYFAWVMGQMRDHLFRKRKMSDWHKQIACTLDGYFQGNLIKLNVAVYRRTRAMPDPKRQGIDFFHRHMCEGVF